MPWPTTPWSAKTAAELRPVIVALCNAVGDRFECIGWNRPSWTVNTAQSISTVTVGTKSTALVENDLFGLDIFRYNWWTLIANHITTLVNLGTTSPGTTGFGNTTHCGGWSKTSTGTGVGTDVWTISDLETDVGLGTLSSSVIGGAMHLFDEVAAERLREFLDRLIYPVIFPYDRGQDWTDLTSDGFDTTAIEAAEDASNKSHTATTDPLDGDEAWAGLSSAVSAQTIPRAFVGFVVLGDATALLNSKRYSILSFDDCQNGFGCLGTIATQILVFHYSCADCDGADLEFQGATISISGTDTSEYVTASGTDFSAVSGKVASLAELTNFANAPDSPFSGTGTYLGDPWVGFGSVICTPYFLFVTDSNRDGGDREHSTRLILDISGEVADQ